ncbi:MAG: ArsA family ATPase [Promethearchaeota archaeon]
MIERIIVLGGKGGVGKSTISAATAVALSDLLPEKKILLISFDIAHNISDLFDREVGDKLTKLTDNLWGIEPDPDVYAEEYTEEFNSKMRELMKRMPIVGQIPQIKNFIDTTMTSDSIPLALKNSMFFQKILDADNSIYRDQNVEAIDFDIVVADFPPTGNMIALFDIPEDQVRVLLKYTLNFFNSIRDAVKTFRKTMMKPLAKLFSPISGQDTRREIGKEVFKMLKELEERGTRISELIHKKGSLRLVTIAEKPSFEEIKRARDLSRKYITLDGVHINMLTPKKSAKKCKFCGKMHTQQNKYMTEIKEEFKNLTIWESDKLEDEPIGLDGLRRLAREVYGDVNPEEILTPNKK